MLTLYKKLKKYNEIQSIKNKMDFNNRKMENHPPSPGDYQRRIQATPDRNPQLQVC